MKILKKILLIVLIFIVLVMASLFIIPYVFKDKILVIAKKQINEMLIAKVDFETLNLSLFKNFPKATASLKNISIIGIEEFENDTLLFSKEVNLVFDLSSLFKDDGYDVKKLEFKDPQVLAYILEDGKANYDIVKDDSENVEDEATDVVESIDDTSSSFRLKLKDVKISNAKIHYVDKESAMELLADKLNLSLSGDLTADNSLLKAVLKIEDLSFLMDNDKYLSNTTLDFNAKINADLNDYIFEFKENNIKLNDLALSFDGWVAMPDDAIDMDIKLNTDKVTFKSILSLIPAIYSSSFNSLKADGNIDLNGFIKGKLVGEDYPSFDLNLKVINAWFQYPDLPGSVKDINIDARITNPGGSLDATVVNVPALKFDFAGNPFGAEAYIAHPVTNPDLRVKAVGKLDLGMIKDVFPLEDGIKLNGLLNLDLKLDGVLTEETYPSFDINLKVSDALFQYPDLPSSLKDINLDARITNPGGSLDGTIVDVPVLKFDLGGNPFEAEAYVANPMSDPDLRVKAAGKLDLGIIKDIYPLEDGMELNGLLNLDLNLNGRMSYYETGRFDLFKFGGRLLIENMLVKYPELGQDVNLHKADFQFSDRYVNLSSFNVNIGRNDLSANGRLENFIPYIFKDETIKGELSLQSKYLNLNDFISESDESSSGTGNVPAETEQTTSGVIELPKNINFALKAMIEEFIFDKMEFKNVQGNLQLANGQLNFKNLGLEGFGGNLVLNGNYNTQNISRPSVDMNLIINNVEFTKIFSQVDMLQSFAPVLEKATGNFSSNLSLRSILTKDMSPDLNTVFVDGTLKTASVGLQNVPALEALASNLKIGDKFSSFSAKDLFIKFSIKDGKLHTDPFNINAGDVKMSIGGETGLDKSIDYKGTINLPENLKLGKLSTVNFKIGGTFTQPKVQLDVKDVINETIDDIKSNVKEEIDNKIDEAKDKVNEEIDKQKEKLNEEIQKQREKLIQEAQKQAENLKSEAKKQGDKLVAEAKKQGDNLIEKASNPIAKKAAEASAKKLVEEAQKQADNLYKKAEEEGNKLIQEAQKI